MPDHAPAHARPPGMPVLVWLSVALIGYNAALNLVPFPGWAYVPANLALTAVLVLAGSRAGLSTAEMGLQGGQRRGLALGFGLVLLVGAGLLVASRVPAVQPLLLDQRAAGLRGWSLVHGAGFRIPLGTVLPEEVIFRGVLLAMLHRRMRWWRAAACSSAAFGLWHIGPTIVLARANALDVSGAAAFGIVGLAVLLTFGAGLLFCLLRRWGGGLVAPVLTHVATNSLGLLAAAAAQGA